MIVGGTHTCGWCFSVVPVWRAEKGKRHSMMFCPSSLHLSLAMTLKASPHTGTWKKQHKRNFKMYREKLFDVSATAVRSSVILPSIISHLLQLLRGECCHVRTTLLQSLELCWSQHWVTIKDKQLSKQLALFLPPTYKKIYCLQISCLPPSGWQQNCP